MRALSTTSVIPGGGSDVWVTHLFMPYDASVYDRVGQITSTGRGYQSSQDALAGVLANILDRLCTAFIIVDRELYVEHVNLRARELLTDSSSLRIANGHLAGRDPYKSRLKRYVCEAVRCPGTENYMVWPGLGGENEGESQLAITSIPSRDTTIPSVASAVVFAFTATVKRSARLDDTLSAIYGLSGAESRVASHLANGESLTKAAEQNCISINTAKTHLRQIFYKTGCCRQSEFIHLVLSGPAGQLHKR